MLIDKPYDHGLWKRLLDYYASSTPWSRQLWRLGTVLEMQELLEAWSAASRGILSDAAVKYLAATTVRRVKADPGLGTQAQRGALVGHLNRDLLPGSHDAAALRILIEEHSREYLSNWARELIDEPSPEAASRAIGSHLIDEGFGAITLHKWFTYHGKYAADPIGIAQMIQQAAELCKRPSVCYEFIVPLTASPPLPDQDGGCWLSPTQTVIWLDCWFPDNPPVRQAGALRVVHFSRDVNTTVEYAADEVERLSARFRVGARRRLEFHPEIYMIGQPRPLTYVRKPRRVEVHALERTNAIFDLRLAREIDSALELLEPLDRGTPAAALAGSWAALETLFIGPGDTRNRVIAATRMARIVACSYVRYELTSLANAHATTGADDLAKKLRCVGENYDRALLLEDEMRNGRKIEFERIRHSIAFARMARLLTSPEKILPRINGQLEDAFRRLYRQRNLVVHSGDLASIAMQGTLRTVAPLMGAGIDRIVHASAVSGLSPLELAARAEVKLAQAQNGKGRLVELLG
jgi:hypothetical protein